jgi:hypothetical protein
MGTSRTFREVIGGQVLCAHCREKFHKDYGWPARDGLICPDCKNTWNQISDLCR